jgi:hypothetical protein
MKQSITNANLVCRILRYLDRLTLLIGLGGHDVVFVWQQEQWRTLPWWIRERVLLLLMAAVLLLLRWCARRGRWVGGL